MATGSMPERMPAAAVVTAVSPDEHQLLTAMPAASMPLRARAAATTTLARAYASVSRRVPLPAVPTAVRQAETMTASDMLLTEPFGGLVAPREGQHPLRAGRNPSRRLRLELR